jgi:hypothetical protein
MSAGLCRGQDAVVAGRQKVHTARAAPATACSHRARQQVRGWGPSSPQACLSPLPGRGGVRDAVIRSLLRLNSAIATGNALRCPRSIVSRASGWNSNLAALSGERDDDELLFRLPVLTLQAERRVGFLKSAAMLGDKRRRSDRCSIGSAQKAPCHRGEPASPVLSGPSMWSTKARNPTKVVACVSRKASGWRPHVVWRQPAQLVPASRFLRAQDSARREPFGPADRAANALRARRRHARPPRPALRCDMSLLCGMDVISAMHDLAAGVLGQ